MVKRRLIKKIISKRILIKKRKVLPKKKVALKIKPRPKTKLKLKQYKLSKSHTNPIIAPRSHVSWESWQTFNPAALYEDGKVHLLYRAIGSSGLSVVGYASSSDGITVDERSDEPVYVAPAQSSGESKQVDFDFVSGGGWGGCEDPRITKIGNTVHMLYVAFDGWSPPRIALTSIGINNFLNKKWKWGGVKIISPPGIVDKSGVLFPEKINGKYVIMHRVFPNILIDYVDNLDFKDGKYLKGEHSIKVRKNKWDSRKIGAGAPPIKTPYGWLLLYYAVDDKDASKYKIGAMLLDLKNPAKVLHRTDAPILEPLEWYENEGHKAGIAYPCGAVVMGNILYVYYGGADSVVCVATVNLKTFLQTLMKEKTPKLARVLQSSRV